jgi:hypothetical protein
MARFLYRNITSTENNKAFGNVGIKMENRKHSQTSSMGKKKVFATANMPTGASKASPTLLMAKKKVLAVFGIQMVRSVQHKLSWMEKK